jgi:fructose transport system substrate-binding protein
VLPVMLPRALAGHRSSGHLCRTVGPRVRPLAPLRMSVPHLPTASDRVRASVRRLIAGALLAAVGVTGCGGARASQPVIGLITKTETNPFFVKMREGAAAAAAARGARLLSGAGKNDGDNAGQVTALENMIAAGARVVLITVNDAKAIVPAIAKARAQGVLVIALDSPTDPVGAVDALYATDNYRAGTLIGHYARAALGVRPPRIATLDLLPGHPVGAQRHNGFLAGLGLAAPGAESHALGQPAEVACMVDTYGDQARGQTAMENCLQRDPAINLVYAINEPAAAGASKALAAAGRERDVVVVAVDGGCEGVREVRAGRLWATAQQYPVKMAELGVAAGVEFIRTGKKPSGYTDTGVALIAARPMPGVESRTVAAGLEQCFGDR